MKALADMLAPHAIEVRVVTTLYAVRDMCDMISVNDRNMAHLNDTFPTLQFSIDGPRWNVNER